MTVIFESRCAFAAKSILEKRDHPNLGANRIVDVADVRIEFNMFNDVG
jgi:hypothetical protein